MIEVEVKLWARDPDRLVRDLDRLGRRLGEFECQDVYYVPAGGAGDPSRRFRLRRQAGQATVNFKQRLEVEGCEANLEREFTVSDLPAFCAFAETFGFKIMLEKQKRGTRWRLEAPGQPSALVDLVEVVGLGRFFELELLVSAESEIEPARAQLHRLLEELGVDPADLEPTPYTRLLAELETKDGGPR